MQKTKHQYLNAILLIYAFLFLGITHMMERGGEFNSITLWKSVSLKGGQTSYLTLSSSSAASTYLTSSFFKSCTMQHLLSLWENIVGFHTSHCRELNERADIPWWLPLFPTDLYSFSSATQGEGYGLDLLLLLVRGKETLMFRSREFATIKDGSILLFLEFSYLSDNAHSTYSL